MVKWQNEGQAVISLISPVSAKHWREYVEKHWNELTRGITGEFRMMVMAGVHGGRVGEIGDAAANIVDIENQAVCNFVAQTTQTAQSIFDRERESRTVLRVTKIISATFLKSRKFSKNVFEWSCETSHSKISIFLL